jgi:hypothetical protein
VLVLFLLNPAIEAEVLGASGSLDSRLIIC